MGQKCSGCQPQVQRMGTKLAGCWGLPEPSARAGSSSSSHHPRWSGEEEGFRPGRSLPWHVIFDQKDLGTRLHSFPAVSFGYLKQLLICFGKKTTTHTINFPKRSYIFFKSSVFISSCIERLGGPLHFPCESERWRPHIIYIKLFLKHQGHQVHPGN